ncbi:MAG: YHS domain protein [Hyphomicrobiales bacterium]|nr:MAG: YHS domain protein [Hyphomicrobiales bacterium]
MQYPTRRPTRHPTRRGFLIQLSAGAAALAIAGPAFAAKPELFTGLVEGVAVGGYDPVAYFTMGKAVEGSAEHALMHQGAKWHFSSAENKAMFMSNPDKYSPQFGGYCAYAVSQGGTAKGEPEVWKIVDDKLYLNYNRIVQGIWSADIPGNISKATMNWPKVLAN